MTTKNRQQLIDDLALNLRPMKATNVTRMVVIYLACTTVFTWLAMAESGSFRSGFMNQLVTSPQFLIETIAGMVAIFLLLYFAFQLAIPAPRKLRQRLGIPLIALLIWVGFYIVGLFYPALPASTEGMRHHCDYQVFIISLPTLLISYYWVYKQWPVYPVSSGFLVGLATGSISALIMQFACMYSAEHTLTAHMLPGLLVGGVGAVLGFTVSKIKKYN